MNKQFILYWLESPELQYEVVSSRTWSYKSGFDFYEFRELLYRHLTNDVFKVKTKRGWLVASRKDWQKLINECR